MEELKKDAEQKYEMTHKLNKFNYLLNTGVWVGKESRHLEEFKTFLENSYNEAKKSIEENAWYKAELKALQKLQLELPEDIEGDPFRKITMAEVFAKV